MTDLRDAIEGMRQRMLAQGAAESDLVAALGATLAEADDRLMKGVRLIAAQHAARRGAIGQELQALAASLGQLPAPRPPEIEGRFAPPPIAASVQPIAMAAPGPLPRFIGGGRAA